MYVYFSYYRILLFGIQFVYVIAKNYFQLFFFLCCLTASLMLLFLFGGVTVYLCSIYCVYHSSYYNR